MWLEVGRVRRLLRFSLADGERRKSRKPAPLPIQRSLKPRTIPRGSLYRKMRANGLGWSRAQRSLCPIMKVCQSERRIFPPVHDPPGRAPGKAFFIGRRSFLDRAQVAAFGWPGKRILITGAGGWIGSALTRAIAEFAPEHMVLLEAAERNLYEIDAALRQLSCPIEHVPILGSVSDPILLAEIFRRYRPQICLSRGRFQARSL